MRCPLFPSNWQKACGLSINTAILRTRNKARRPPTLILAAEFGERAVNLTKYIAVDDDTLVIEIQDLVSRSIPLN